MEEVVNATNLNMSKVDISGDTELPPEPEKPLPTDCCGSGCSPCVFDIYEKDMEAWRRECVQANNKGMSVSEYKPNTSLSIKRYTPLELMSVTKVNADTSIYRFKVPQSKSLKLEVGNHFLLRSKSEGKVVTRAYTPIDCGQGYFDVIIKLYPDGRMSKCISELSVGDMVDWRGPFSKLKYSPNEHDHVIMIAAGTGITPMLQLIRKVLDSDDDDTRLTLLYSCKKASDILLKDQLDDFSSFWNFNVMYFLTQTQPEDDQSCLRYGDLIFYRRLDQHLLSENLPRTSDRTKILVCGTKSFNKDMINFAFNLGYKENNIFIF